MRRFHLYLTGLALLCATQAWAGSTNWAFTLDNVDLTFKAFESVNGVTVCGTLAYPTTGFTQFSVAASATVNSVSCTTTVGGLAPTVGTIFYGLQIPGLAQVTYPILTNETQLVYAVSSGTCPTSNYNANFLFTQENPAGLDNFTLNGQPGFGVADWINGTSTMNITNLYNLSSATTVPGLAAFSLTSTGCTGGVYSLPGLGDRGGTMYMNNQGTAMFRTNGSKGIFVIPQIPVQDIMEIAGNYAVLSAVNGLAGTSGYQGVNGAVIVETDRIAVSVSGTSSTGNTVNPSTGASTGISTSFTATAVNSPTGGYIRGTYTQNGLSADLSCIVYLTNLQNTLFCQGQNPASPTNAINLMLVGDIPTTPVARPLGGFNAAVSTITAAIDSANLGKVYVGGGFSTYVNNLVNSVARLNSDGTLDTSFNVGTGFNYGGPLGSAVAIDSASLGKVYFFGESISAFNGNSIASPIARLNSNGSFDTSFTPQAGPYIFLALAPAIDTGNIGKIYLGGNFSVYGVTTVNNIVRLNTDGSLDTSFASGSGFDSEVVSISPALDSGNLGKIYVSGSFLHYQGLSNRNIIRINSDGTPDSTFATGSGFFYSYPHVYTATDSANLGKVYTWGYTSLYNGQSVNYLNRINSDGTLDTTFNCTTCGAQVDGFAIATDTANAGKLLIGSTTTPGLFRINTDGSNDSSFNPGSGTTQAPTTIALALDSANVGKLWLGGSFFTFNGVVAQRIDELNSNGSQALAPVVDQGFQYYSGTLVSAIDTANIGRVYVSAPAYNYTNFSGAGGVVRLNEIGTPDWSYNGTNANSEVTSITPAVDTANLGNLYLGGYFTTYQGVTANYIARAHTDGSLDTTFNTGSGFNAYVSTVFAANDPPNLGSVYVGGDFSMYGTTTQNSIARLYSTGSLDTSFNIGTGFNGNVNTITTAIDSVQLGKVYVAGLFSYYGSTFQKYLIRLNTNGSFDSTFNIGTSILPGGNIVVLAPAIDTPNLSKIYMAGSFTTVGTFSEGDIVRMNSDGSVDTTFNVGSGFDGEVYAVVPAVDSANLGKVYAGGSFAHYKGTVVNDIARLNTDASLDTTFSIGTGFDNGVESLSLALDAAKLGSVYVSGYFTQYNGTPAAYFIRLSSTGAPN